jgi:hypothetical protein
MAGERCKGGISLIKASFSYLSITLQQELIQITPDISILNGSRQREQVKHIPS